MAYFDAFCMHRAVQEIFCSGGYGSSLPVLRASIDAHASWAIDPRRRRKKIIIQEASDFGFPPRRGEDVPWCGVGRRWLAFFYTRAL